MRFAHVITPGSADPALAVIREDEALLVRDLIPGGPQFLEVMCYRWKEHVGPGEDYHAGYRSLDEARPWLANDQVKLVGDRLDPDRRRRVEDEVEAEVRAAFAFAEEAPFPDGAELYTDLFKGS